MIRHHDVPSYKLNFLRVLQAVNHPEMNLCKVSERIKAEVSLSYHLLRYLNSPAFPLVTEVHSIPHALSLLGERGVGKWVSLVAVACMGDEKSAELVALPLIRALLRIARTARRAQTFSERSLPPRATLSHGSNPRHAHRTNPEGNCRS